jgi:hypothetical protein
MSLNVKKNKFKFELNSVYYFNVKLKFLFSISVTQYNLFKKQGLICKTTLKWFFCSNIENTTAFCKKRKLS